MHYMSCMMMHRPLQVLGEGRLHLLLAGSKEVVWEGAASRTGRGLAAHDAIDN